MLLHCASDRVSKSSRLLCWPSPQWWLHQLCMSVTRSHAVIYFTADITTRRDSVPYAALYIAPILIDTRLHSTRGQFFIRHECGACIRLRTNTSLIRMISRSAYGFGIFVITCLHTSDERVQTLYTSCIRIVSNPFSVLHT